MPSLDQQIDALYQLPRGEFTAARNALAKTLTSAAQSRVRALVKPALVPWIVNQVYWQARSLYDRLIKTGGSLRAAQLDALKAARQKTPKPGDSVKRREAIDRAVEAHRTALAAAVARAVAIAESAGSHPDGLEIGAMLEALSLAPKPPDSPGRFTEVPAPIGFAALK